SDLGGGRHQPNIAHLADHFQNLAACGKHAAAATLVSIESLHELDLVVGVIAFASRGVDLPATLYLRPAFAGDRHLLLASISPAGGAALDGHFSRGVVLSRFLSLCHSVSSLCEFSTPLNSTGEVGSSDSTRDRPERARIYNDL